MDVIKASNLPLATTSIIILNTVVFAFGLLSGSQEQIIRHYGFSPEQLFLFHNLSLPQFPLAADTLTRLFSSIFIHANIVHIAFNLLALVYLGGYAERSIGVFRYVFIYIIAGIVGALFYGIIAIFILGNAHSILIGASGAISGILGIAAAFGNTRAYYWFLFQIVFAVIGSVSAIPIAFTAHVGGFISGVILTRILIKFERKKRMKYWKNSSDDI
jgi:membrane associated rhomboid family serine protease